MGRQSEERSFANEREILYQVLFDMKRDITSLKQTIATMRQEPHYEPIHTTLVPTEMEPMHTDAEEVTEPDSELVATPMEEPPLPDKPMTIEEAERILIMRALERHGGNTVSYTHLRAHET